MSLSSSTFRQTGWSLPFTWIMLIAFIGVFYFYSWMGLVYLVGFFVLMCIVTFIYGMFQPEHEYEASGIAEVNYWFESGDTIEQVAEQLANGFNLRATSIKDKWILIESERYNFNLTQTYEADSNQNAIYHLHIESDSYHLDDEEEPFLGRKLANVIKTDIHCEQLDPDSNRESNRTDQNVYRYKPESD